MCKCTPTIRTVYCGREDCHSTDQAEALAVSRNFLTLEDVALLKHIGANLPPDRWGYGLNVVDLGAGSGTTALSIFESNAEAIVWTYDISPEAIDWTMAAIDNCGFSRRWHSQAVSAVEAAGKYPHPFASAILLDASHLYEETRDELNAWYIRVASGGWLWCHDYVGDGGVAENGVKRAVDQFIGLCEQHDYLAERIESGLGIALRFK